MVVVQLIVGLMSFTYSDEINQLEADDLLFKSANRTMDYWTQHGGVKPPQRQEDIDTEFWTVTQRTVSLKYLPKSHFIFNLNQSNLYILRF